MLIKHIIEAEAKRNEQMIHQYEVLLKDLPRGSLICRKQEYFYLKYREAGKLHDEYIGKDPVTVSALRKKLEQRKHISQMLSALKKEQQTIQKILEDLT